MNLYPESGQEYNAWAVYQLAEVNKKEKFAVFEIMNNDFWRGGEARLNVRGDDLKTYKENQTVLFGHNSDAPLGQAQWTRHYPSFANATSVRSKWGPPDIKTEGKSERQRMMIDFANEVFDWVEAGQIKGASVGIVPKQIFFGQNAVEKYREDYPEDRSQKSKNLIVYIQTFDMFEWSITPIPRIASALRQSCSDFAKKQLDNVTSSPYYYLDLESRLSSLENTLAETLGQNRKGFDGDGARPLVKTRDLSRDVSRVDTEALLQIVNKRLRNES
ncbi:MAG: hypothetical protein KDC45_09360 [Bacteroidetes bacterium]|nr:hypothetical protein [Bacteroidota bacterium]